MLSRNDENEKWIWTDLIKYYQFWCSFSGKYVNVTSNESDILTLVFLDKRYLKVVINNLEKDKNINLSLLSLNGENIKNVFIE